jgi:hypothetical protein
MHLLMLVLARSRTRQVRRLVSDIRDDRDDGCNSLTNKQ